MASQTEICNLALLRIGAARIAALTENSNEARYCSQLWDPVRRAALRSHPWNFALAVNTSLVAAVGGAQPGFAYAYALPTDNLRVLAVINPLVTDVEQDMGRDNQEIWDGDDGGLDQFQNQSLFEVRQNSVLCTNIASAGIKYIVDVTDTTKFDDRFVEALSYRLAADLALPVTGNPQITQSMIQLFSSAVQAARLADSQEGKRRVSGGNSFLQARL